MDSAEPRGAFDDDALCAAALVAASEGRKREAALRNRGSAAVINDARRPPESEHPRLYIHLGWRLATGGVEGSPAAPASLRGSEETPISNRHRNAESVAYSPENAMQRSPHRTTPPALPASGKRTQSTRKILHQTLNANTHTHCTAKAKQTKELPQGKRLPHSTTPGGGARPEQRVRTPERKPSIVYCRAKDPKVELGKGRRSAPFQRALLCSRAENEFSGGCGDGRLLVQRKQVSAATTFKRKMQKKCAL